MGSPLFASDALSFARIKKWRGFVILSEAKLQRSGRSPRGQAFHL
jgi:hypothetical protein